MSDQEHVIVVGVDGSASSEAALAWAAKQASLTGAELRAVTAWFPALAYGSGVAFQARDDLKESTAELVEETLDKVLGKERTKVSTSVVEGPPALVLVDAAGDADLLVVGSRGHGAFAGMLLGSVSEYCVSHAHCPVVVIREPHQVHQHEKERK